MSDDSVEYGHWIWNSERESYDWMPWIDDSENIESYSDDERTDDDSIDEELSDEETTSDEEASAEDENSSDEDAVSDDEVALDDEASSSDDTSADEDTDEEADALIIYDFDDTLFPTTYLKNELENRQFARDIDEVELPDDLAKEVDKLETDVLNLLCDSLALGTVKIVTNGSMSWVQSACRALMPYLWDFVIEKEIEVISARYLYEDVVEDHWEHKKRVFEDEVKEHTDIDMASAKDFKFVSIGDAQFERYAAKQLKNIIPKDCIKIIKLESDPTIKELEWQMGMLSDVVREAAESDDFVDDDYGS